MPRLEVQERHEEVESESRKYRENHVGHDTVAHADAGPVDFVYDDPDTGKHGVDHDDSIRDHRSEVQFRGTLWSVAERDDELCAYEEHQCVAKDVEDVFAEVVSKWVHLFVSKTTCHEVEGEVEVGQREIREEKLDKLVEGFDQ